MTIQQAEQYQVHIDQFNLLSAFVGIYVLPLAFVCCAVMAYKCATEGHKGTIRWTLMAIVLGGIYV